MATTLGFLAQNKPAGTTAVTLYTPASAIEVSVKVVCVNLGSVPVDISIYMDDGGTATYDDTTVRAKDVTVPPGRKYIDYILMSGTGNDLGVKTSIADAVNFIAEGVTR